MDIRKSLMEGERNMESVTEDHHQQTQKKEKKRLQELTDLHARALDDLVNVNSLFTMAVFIGLSFATPNQQSLENRPECDADPDMVKTLVMYEVTSFALFLVSSLAAKALKVVLNFYPIDDKIELAGILDSLPLRQILLSDAWGRIMFAVSGLASASGIMFLTLSMVNVIQIKLGKLSCGSNYTLKSVIILTTLVFGSLFLLYIPPVLFAGCSRPKSSKKKSSHQTRIKVIQ